MNLEWPLRTVEALVDAIFNKNDVIFRPCDGFKDAKSYLVNFVKEEIELWNVLKEREVKARLFIVIIMCLAVNLFSGY